MRLFVTGSSSFIGRALLARCDRDGIAVNGIDLAPPDRDDCRQADLCGGDLADLLPEAVDAVVHLAALSRDADCRGRLARCFEVNVMATLRLAEAARNRGARQFIFASSEWVYGALAAEREVDEDTPLSPAALTSEYALSKLVAEAGLAQLFADAPLPTTLLRFGIVYGPRSENWSAVESLLAAVARDDTVEVGALATARRFFHRDDVAASILAAVGVPGLEIFNIQGPALVSLGEIIATAKAMTGRDPEVVERQTNRPNLRRVSSRKAESVLGWQAQIDLSEGLASVARFLAVHRD